MIERISIGIFILLTVVFSSCKKENSEPVMGNLQFVYDWGKLPADIQCGEGMQLCFYGEDGTVYERESNITSFNGSLPEGIYQVLLRNRPTTGIGFRGEESYETAETYLLPASRTSEFIGQPGWLFAAALARCEVSATKPTTLSVVPQSLVHRITFKLKITGRPVESVTASLRNVATALNLSTGLPAGSSVGEMDIPVERSGEWFNGQVRIFTLLNKSGEKEKNLKLTIHYADMTDKTIELDISDQLDDLHEGIESNVEIEIQVDSDDVRWAIRLASEIRTKGGPVDGNSLATGSEVGVYTLENMTGSTPVWGDGLLMDNQPCRAESSGVLTYEPLQYYKENARYSFYAYYPYTADALSSSSGSSPKLACRFAPTPAEQVDYMYATPLENRESAGEAQQLSFNHALSQIKLEFVNRTEKKLVLHTLKIHGPGGATLDIASGKWTLPTASQAYTLYTSTAGLEISAGATGSVPGQLMLLPSEVADVPYTLDISVTCGDDPSLVEHTGLALTSPGSSLIAGVSHLYTVNYTINEEEDPDTPDDPNPPNDPEPPIEPDNPNVPDTPDIPDIPDVPDIPDKTDITVTFKATLSAWTPVDAGDTDAWE